MAQENAQVDVIHNGQVASTGDGSLAKKLLANNFNVSKLRTLDIMRTEEWKQFDQVILQEVLLRMRGVADLMGMGLEYNMRAVGLAKTVLQWETSSEMQAAEITMDGVTRAQRDRVLINNANLLPLFITHKDVQFTAREIAEMRNNGTPIDTMNVQMAARKVAESLESLLFKGPSEIISLPTVWGNAKAYGYTTAPNRIGGSLAHTWTSGSATAAGIKNDVLAMKQALINNRMYGPYMMYVPTAYEHVLDDDYVTTTNAITTIRQRILMVGGIQDIRVADFMPANTVLMVQMTTDVVDLVVAQDPIIVPWEEQGGMLLNFKVLTCMVPRMKSTYGLRSGIAHYTGS